MTFLVGTGALRATYHNATNLLGIYVPVTSGK